MEGLPSDDESFSYRLDRNFSDREDAQNVIQLIDSIQRLHYLLAYIYNESWCPIVTKVQRYYDACCSNAIPVPLNRAQWVAVSRISWMVDEFTELLISYQVDSEDEACINDVSRMLTDIQDESAWFRKVLNLDYERCGGVLDDKSRCAIEEEYVEEICFELRDSLPKAFREDVYCAVARQLLRELCKKSQKWLVGTRSSQETAQLLVHFYDCAELARNEISSCCATGSLDSLAFNSGVQNGSFLSGSLSEIIGAFKTSAAFYLQCNTTPKGVRAALVEACPYLEPCDQNIEKEIGDRFIMMNIRGVDLDLAGHQHLAVLGSIPVEQSKCGIDDINIMWYIQWQVVYLVDLFASRYCGADGYNVETLCERVGADRNVAQFVVDRGIRENDGCAYRDFCHVKKAVVASMEGQSVFRENINCMYSRGELRAMGVSELSSVAKNEQFRQLEQDEKGTTQHESMMHGNYELSTIPGEKPNCIYNGAPKTFFPGCGNTWPQGWSQRTEVRTAGKSKGHHDNYWYPPDMSKLRSRREILRYLEKHKMAQYLHPSI